MFIIISLKKCHFFHWNSLIFWSNCEGEFELRMFQIAYFVWNNFNFMFQFQLTDNWVGLQLKESIIECWVWLWLKSIKKILLFKKVIQFQVGV